MPIYDVTYSMKGSIQISARNEADAYEKIHDISDSILKSELDEVEVEKVEEYYRDSDDLL